MANDLAVTPGSGAVVATDEVTGKHYQLVKLASGTEDVADRIGGDATNGLDVDVTRVIPGTTSTALGKAEDAAHASGDVGVMALGVRKDTAGTLAGTDGDYVPLQFDASGAVRVTGAGGGTQYVDGTTAATPTGTALFWRDGSNVMRPVSAATPMPTEVIAGALSLTGEDHIGEVGGHTTVLTPTVTLSVTPDYSVGDVMGGEITLTNAVRVNNGTGVLQSVTLTDATNTKPELDLVFFRSNPALTYTDNAAYPAGATDEALLCGIIHVATTNWITFSDVARCTVPGGFGVQAGSGATHLYLVIVTRTIYNAAAPTDLRVFPTILAD